MSTQHAAPSPNRTRPTPTITLAHVITRFESEFLARYQHRLLPSHIEALKALQTCRTSLSTQMLAQCTGCGEQRLVPHSCGHRSCPHCQHFESQRWIKRQTQALRAGTYFLITFTLPAELRPLAWSHQQTVYGLLMQCAWDTLAQFSRNHRQLQGLAGAVGVLHTHSRHLEFHLPVHLGIPGAAFEHAAHRQRSALLVVGAATRPAQGIAPLTQLWPVPSQFASTAKAWRCCASCTGPPRRCAAPRERRQH